MSGPFEAILFGPSPLFQPPQQFLSLSRPVVAIASRHRERETEELALAHILSL